MYTQHRWTSPDPLYGRETLLTGPLASRLHALYLVCRMLLDDKDCPVTWKTQNLFPTTIRGGGGMGGGMMTTKGVFAQPTPPLPRQFPYAQQPPQHQAPQQHPQQGQQPYGQNPVASPYSYPSQPMAGQAQLGMGLALGGLQTSHSQQRQAPIQPPGGAFQLNMR
jgi:hypothetical protein